MGWLEAVVKIVTGVAWPAVVLTAVLMLRKELTGLFGRMTRVMAPGVEAEFASEVAATGEIAEAAVPDPPDEMTLQPIPGDTSPLPTNPTLDDLLIEADRHPVGAVVRAWNLVEYVVRRGFGEANVGYTPSAAIKRLAIEGQISDDLLGVAGRLSRLRSQIVHGSMIPDRETAREFVTAAWRLATALKIAAPVSVVVQDGDGNPAG